MPGNTVARPRQARAVRRARIEEQGTSGPSRRILEHVPEDPRPPVAVRISRPQATEEEFLEQELDTLNRTSVTLLGAQQRPNGVVLRFELVLSSGIVVLRGEGRVVGFKADAMNGLGGLTLRFTRLDSKSKALIDKATALRDRRRPSSMPAPPPDRSPAAPPVATDPPASVRPPPVQPSPPASVRPAPLPSRPPPLPSRPPPLPSSPPPAPQREREHKNGNTTLAAATASAPSAPRPTPAAPPGDREALLERLRTRAKTLDAAQVQRILQQRRRA
jgi:hypothetical protein